MYTATKRTIIHEVMVRTRAKNLKTEGYTVYADISGYTKPPQINGYIPDIYAVKDNLKIIVEVETCDTISDEHTRNQYLSFSNIMGTQFHIVVPESCLSQAKQYAQRWRIKVDKWWYHKGY